MSIDLNKKLTPREGMNFMQRVFTKISPAQLEATMLVFISGFAAFMIFRNDIVMPGYSKVVQGDRESYGSDPVDTYKMEPIFDDNGKLKAMRKVRIKQKEVQHQQQFQQPQQFQQQQEQHPSTGVHDGSASSSSSSPSS